MLKHLKKLLSPIMMALVLTAPQMSQAMDVSEEYSYTPSNIWNGFLSMIGMGSQETKPVLTLEKAVILFPNVAPVSDTLGLILKEVVKDGCHEYGCHKPGFVGNIGSVCKAWYNFVTEERHISPFYKAPQVNLITKCIHDCRIDSHEYMNFYNGELIFRPTLGSDEGMVRLKISDCLNLSKGIFNLSGCGGVGKYLSISIGYRKGIIPENKDKVEIWFAPRKFIEQELKEGRAQQFVGIFPSWKPNASIGIFWTWANDDNLNWFDYLITSDNLTLSFNNLYENWVCASPRRRSTWAGAFLSKNFMFILNNQN